jgi:ATP-dependent Clp protease ATP-binding subunit ClpC
MDSLLPFLIIAGAVFLIRVSYEAGLRKAKQQVATPTATPVSDIYSVAAPITNAYQGTAHPADVTRLPQFVAAAQFIAKSSYSHEELIRYATGDNALISCIALEALSTRESKVELRRLLLQNVNAIGSPWSRYFALRALHLLTPPPSPLILDVLSQLGGDWTEDAYERYTPQFVKEFIQLRLRDGEQLAAADDLSPKAVANIHRALTTLDPQLGAPIRAVVDAAADVLIDVAWLESIGKVWKAADCAIDDIITSPELEAAAAEVEKALSAERRRGVMLVGETGVGKGVLTRMVAHGLHRQGWTIFEAEFNDLLAGQSYIGQFEERLRLLSKQLRGRRVLWLVKDLPALVFAGRHSHNPVGAMDTLLPFLETGEIMLLAATQPPSYEKLVRENARIGAALRSFRIRALTDEATLELAQRWADARRIDEGTPLIAGEVLAEGWQLALQYLGATASPGNLIELLKETHERVRAAGRPIAIEDLIATLESVTGLPAAILDERLGLDLDALRSHFAERVIGQREAVDALVERVAMIKAGLTDPRRPLGVFLFAGPTGTGKTEIAKALAEFLFGSANRMIRIDMSELQSLDSLSRLIGDPDPAVTGGSLVEQVRRQPFSIVLLDEFEKAHPNAWDLFLQLFDDGRLSDRRGATADFRHALIIMTSNIGAAIQTSGRMGFSNEGSAFTNASVRAALDRHFRKEFLNRIDRIVIFQPLARETMRHILKKELDHLNERRGLRNRPWAVEWDGSAIDFLLEQGFTPDLGARPLKRAIDQHLLSPLAMSIVNRSLPTGEQFLYVRSDGEKLAIDFIDANQQESPAGAERAAEVSGYSLQELVLDCRGSAEEIAFIESVYDELQCVVNSDIWRQKKEINLSMTALPEFWQSNDRYKILSDVEYRDRIEAGLETAGSLLARLKRQTTTPGLVERLAQQLFLLQTAVNSMEEAIAWECFLQLDGGESGSNLASMLHGMYVGWARLRGMRIETIVDEGRQKLLSVSGYGAYALLRAEHGIHVLEVPRGDSFDREQTRVRVAQQPTERLPRDAASARSRALEIVKAGDPNLQIVRRYRELPSPLVRDAVRNWRTGRLDLVLAGNFDVITNRD